MMLQILPPLAVDTPEEHAALSQYLTNVIDFRDPDATMTHFVSPDVVMAPGRGRRRRSRPLPPTLGRVARPRPSPSTRARRVCFRSSSLAWSTTRSRSTRCSPTRSIAQGQQQGGHQQTNRFFVELVNTLTESAAPPYTPTIGTATTPINPSDVDLRDWDLVLVPDDAFNRPDPTTGQILDPGTFQNLTYGRVPLNASSFHGVSDDGDPHHR